MKPILRKIDSIDNEVLQVRMRASNEELRLLASESIEIPSLESIQRRKARLSSAIRRLNSIEDILSKYA